MSSLPFLWLANFYNRHFYQLFFALWPSALHYSVWLKLLDSHKDVYFPEQFSGFPAFSYASVSIEQQIS